MLQIYVLEQKANIGLAREFRAWSQRLHSIGRLCNPGCGSLNQECKTFSLLPAALRMFTSITAASEFKIFFALHLFCIHTLSLACFHTSV